MNEFDLSSKNDSYKQIRNCYGFRTEGKDEKERHLEASAG